MVPNRRTSPLAAGFFGAFGVMAAFCVLPFLFGLFGLVALITAFFGFSGASSEDKIKAFDVSHIPRGNHTPSQALEKTPQADREEFIRLLQLCGADQSLFVVYPGETENEVRVVVGDYWPTLSHEKQIRLTRDLLCIWAIARFPNDYHNAVAMLLDRKGNEVGYWRGKNMTERPEETLDQPP